MENNISKNIYMGFLSLLFGFFLWLYVLSSAQTKGTSVFEIRYELPPNVAIVSNPVREIKFKINGPRVFIRNLTMKKNTHVVNLKNYFTRGKLDYTLDINDLGIKFPFGVEILEFDPSVINISLEASSVKQIPINLVTSGNIAVDHKLIYSELKPSFISISGPKSVLNQIEKIDSTTINLNELKGSGEKVIKFAPFDPRVELSEDSFSYSYFVKPTRSNMVLKDIPIRFLSSHMVIGSNRRKVNLMVLADNEEKLDFSKEELSVIAQIPLKAKKKMKIPLKAKLPQGMHVLEIIPSEIEVELDLGEKNE